MFDKVLRNEHYIALKILISRRIKTIFCLRPPQDTTPSILKLYQGIDPSHEFNSESFATGYYIQRLDMLERIAIFLEQDSYYLDADSIQHDSNECLDRLSDWLQLDTPLSPNYELQRNTSKERSGDSSRRIKTGRIADPKSEYANVQHKAELLNSAVSTHDRIRKLLIEKSVRHNIFE